MYTKLLATITLCASLLSCAGTISTPANMTFSTSGSKTSPSVIIDAFASVIPKYGYVIDTINRETGTLTTGWYETFESLSNTRYRYSVAVSGNSEITLTIFRQFYIDDASQLIGARTGWNNATTALNGKAHSQMKEIVSDVSTDLNINYKIKTDLLSARGQKGL